MKKSQHLVMFTQMLKSYNRVFGCFKQDTDTELTRK